MEEIKEIIRRFNEHLCPKCGGNIVEKSEVPERSDGLYYFFRCQLCGFEFGKYKCESVYFKEIKRIIEDK